MTSTLNNKIFFGDERFLFTEIKTDVHDVGKCIVILVNNIVDFFSAKLVVIENIFKIYHQILLLKNYEKIVIITLFPKIFVFTINTGNENSKLLFFEHLCKIRFCYNAIFKSDMLIVNIYNILNDIYFETKSIDIVLLDDHDKLKLKKYESEMKNKYNCDHLFFINDGSQLTLTNDSLNMFVLIEEHKKLVTNIGEININITIHSPSIFLANTITDITAYKDIQISYDVLDLIYRLYYVYVSLVLPNGSTMCNIPIYEMFSFFIGIIKENPKHTEMILLLNEMEEWLYLFSLKTITKNLPSTDYNKCIEKLTVGHISHKKYIKMISAMKLKDPRQKMVEIEKTYNNIMHKLIDINDNNDFHYSVYTLNNWVNELEEKSCLGIIMKIYVPDYCRTGKWINDVLITNCTNIFISATDYLDKICIINDEKEFNSDINKVCVINDNLAGHCNLTLPVYICKEHWEMAKCYIPMILGLCFTNNTLLYNDSMINVYYVVLNAYTTYIINDMGNWSMSLIRGWVSLLRTCIKISFDKGYHRGFSKHIEKILHGSDNIQTNILLGQMMSVGFYDVDTYCNLIKIIVHNVIKKYVVRIKKDSLDGSNLSIIIDMIKEKNSMLDTELVNLYNKSSVLNYLNTLKVGWLGLTIIQMTKKNVGGFKKLIELLDSNYSVLPIDIENMILDFCKKDKNTNIDHLHDSFEYPIRAYFTKDYLTLETLGIISKMA